MKLIKQARFSDGESSVVVALTDCSIGEASLFKVSLASQTDSDFNVSYTFKLKPEAVACYVEECSRLRKVGLEMVNETEF